jgi:hypothetical protein
VKLHDPVKIVASIGSSYVDTVYRGHDCDKKDRIFIVKQRRGHTPTNKWELILSDVKADSFRSFQAGASHVHSTARLGQCMRISANWYETTVRRRGYDPSYEGEPAAQTQPSVGIGQGFHECATRGYQTQTQTYPELAQTFVAWFIAALLSSPAQLDSSETTSKLSVVRSFGSCRGVD